MSLDVWLEVQSGRTVFEYNITHNLGGMAEACGVYKHLWRPEELGITKAAELIDPLTTALEKLKSDPAKFEQFAPENGWGSYEGLVHFVEKYLEACKDVPQAIIGVSR